MKLNTEIIVTGSAKLPRLLRRIPLGRLFQLLSLPRYHWSGTM
jgi:hypothetical protein